MKKNRSIEPKKHNFLKKKLAWKFCLFIKDLHLQSQNFIGKNIFELKICILTIMNQLLPACQRLCIVYTEFKAAVAAKVKSSFVIHLTSIQRCSYG
jgi:hypothetical protein